MESADLRIHNATYLLFVDRGQAPSAAEVAAEVGSGEADVRASWARLHDAHVLVSVPTARSDGKPVRREADGLPGRRRGSFVVRELWLDAFGIGAALHVDCEIDTHCPDCGDPLHIAVRDGRPEPSDMVWHVLVPAGQWWADIGFT
jgi:hypothetical protein